MLEHDRLRRELEALSAELRKLSPDTLRRDFGKILAGSPEERTVPTRPSWRPRRGTGRRRRRPGAAPAGALDQFTIDLTAQARAGKIDPILGRDSEIRQIIDILTRRRQNNPILTGEAGVGKTAVVEGFALRIAAGDVPPRAAGTSRCARSTSACCRPAPA